MSNKLLSANKQHYNPLFLIILILSSIILLLGLIGIIFKVGFFYIMGEPNKIVLSFFLYILLLISFCALIKLKTTLSNRTILLIITISYWLLTMFYLSKTEFTRLFEIDQVVRAAKEIAQYGSIVNSPNFDEHLIYFNYYQNVWNTAQYLSVICKTITFFGFEQYMDFALPAIISTFNILTGIPCIYGIVKYFTNNRDASLFSVFLFIIYPAILINSIVPYHFTVVFSLPLIVLYLFIQSTKESKTTTRKRNLTIILIAILTGIGIYICYTPIIPIIAILIICILIKEYRLKALISLALSIAMACSLFFVSNNLYNKEIYRDDLYDLYHLPTEMFVFLALTPDSAGVFALARGNLEKYYSYQQEQVDGLRDSPGFYLESRKDYLRDLIYEEINSYNFFSMIKHFAKKIAAEYDLGSFYGQGGGILSMTQQKLKMDKKYSHFNSSEISVTTLFAKESIF